VSEHALKLKLASPAEREKLKQRLLSLEMLRWEEKGEQYCDYRLDGQAADGWARVKQYTNGTLYLQASNEALMNELSALIPGGAPVQTAPRQLPLANGQVNAMLPAKPSGKLELHGSYIGTDESGKGDYFGPLVTAGVYVDARTIPILVELGVMDSKKLNDKTIATLAREITQVVGTEAIAVIEIGPKRYNELYEKFKSGGRNLNHLLAWGHATAIENVLAHHPECSEAVADQFGNERYILSQLKEKGGRIKLHQLPRAEANVGVAAASILARNRFVYKIKKLSEHYGVELPLGANPKVKAQARLFIERHGRERLAEVAKLHFKTTQEIGFYDSLKGSSALTGNPVECRNCAATVTCRSGRKSEYRERPNAWFQASKTILRAQEETPS
jgi:ribonuclease HIII